MQPDLGTALVRHARRAIGETFGVRSRAPEHVAAIEETGATFVTLRRRGELRGCVGTVSAFRALREDVRANAVAAAFRDPRFKPVWREEFWDIAIEVSLLGTPEAMAFRSEDEALAGLRPGVDGVILECGRRRSTFLPQVWEQLPAPRDFLGALKHKAGLGDGFWSDEVRLARYSVEKFAEEAVTS